jgi:hypothetical protein
MRVFIHLVILAGVWLPKILWGQDTSSSKKNTIEVFYLVNHFFDQTRTNWTVWIPAKGRGVVTPDGRVIKEDIKVIPPTFGLAYTRKLSQSQSLRLSSSIYFMRYLNDSRQPGEVTNRQYGLFSLDCLRLLFDYKNWRVEGIGGVSSRLGYETIHIYYPSIWEQRVESLTFKDVGLTLGILGSCRLPWNFLLTGEASYTRFVYLYDDGVDFFGDHKDSTPNTLTIKLSLGYRF